MERGDGDAGDRGDGAARRGQALVRPPHQVDPRRVHGHRPADTAQEIYQGTVQETQ